MILYVNGDSHSAGAEATNYCCFAEDDPEYLHLGRKAHPNNLEVSYGSLLADSLHFNLVCDAESASSNSRIIRTTKEYLKTNKPDLIIIGWATWEREEWLYDGVYYQVTAGGTDSVPDKLKDKYKQWVIDSVNHRANAELEMHNLIYTFHNKLIDIGIPHLFFNTYNCFSHIRLNDLQRYHWGCNYIDPYSEEFTYYNWLKSNGYSTVNPRSYHFGAAAHKKWAEFLLPHLTRLL